MSIRIMVSVLFAMLITNHAAAQTIVIDMDTASGIQATGAAKDTAQIVTVQVRMIGAVNLFSYQVKVAFDTSRLSYVGVQLDNGPLGEKNILARNGGVVFGVYQVQLNPPASDTIEISGTITGTDPSKNVSGDGLIGVIYFKSRTAVGDSTVIAASNGYTALYGGDITPVAAYAGGKHTVLRPVAVSPDRFSPGRTDGESKCRTVAVAIGPSVAMYDIPPDATRTGAPLTFRLITPGGKCIVTRTVPFSAATRRISIPLPRDASTLSNGVYIGSIGIGGRISSQTIRIH